MTIERLPQTICTPYRMPSTRENHVPGRWQSELSGERRWPATALGYGYQVKYRSIHIIPFCRFPPRRRRWQVAPIPRPGDLTPFFVQFCVRNHTLHFSALLS